MTHHPLACKEPPWQPQLDALERRRAEETMRIKLAFFPLLKDKVLRIFDTHPDWSSSQIAKELDVSSGYVRKTLSRNGRKLARSRIYP